MYGPAKSAFEALRQSADGDDRELDQPADRRVRLLPEEATVRPATAWSRYIDDGRTSGRGAVLLSRSRAARSVINATYLKTVRRIVDRFPDQSWAEEALNNLAHAVRPPDDDDAADARVSRAVRAVSAQSVYTERAAGRSAGVRSARDASTRRRSSSSAPPSIFRAPTTGPRGSSGPAARTNRAEKTELAEARYSLAAADYLNSYYGRLAVERLKGRTPPPRVIADPTTPVAAPPPPNDQVVRALLEIGRYDDALNELRYAQRQLGRVSAAIQATMAWI